MPWEDGVAPEPAAPEAPAAEPSKPAGGKPAKGDDTISLSKKDHEALMRRIQDLEGSERYWAEKVRGGKQEPEEPADPKDDDDFDEGDLVTDDDPEKLADALTSEGVSALEKRGLITTKRMKEILKIQREKLLASVEEIVERRVTGAQKKMLADAEMLQQYPDLQNPKSEMFQRTKELYDELVAEDPSMKAKGLKIAARLAKAELAPKMAANRRADVDRRIAAQQGDMTGFEGGDGDEELTPYQKQIIGKFNQDGGPHISEEAYKKRARAGVNMGSGGYQPGSMRWS